jgi:hypothetical protein
MPSLLAVVELSIMIAVAIFVRLRVFEAATRKISLQFHAIARHKKLSVAIVGVLVLIIRILLIPLLGIPEPRWHDEYSYLLAADTFAHARVTNPPHPMWIHFETFHVIQHPTYMSMYPPLQGLNLAVGQILGHRWIGQLLVTAAMCSAICWMLQGWLPAQWALLGGALAALRLGIMSYWMNTYWAASAVALAGALVIGTLPRLKRRPHSSSALAMGVGMVMLANSRPFEGFLLALAVLVAMIVAKPQLLISAVMLPAALALVIGALATGYFYHRLTGSAFVMTYQVNRSTYSRAPYFIWQAPQPAVKYNNPEMQRFYDREFHDYQNARTGRGFVARTGDKLFHLWEFYLGPLLTLPLIALPWAIRDRRLRFSLAAAGLLFAGAVVEVWTSPHYLAAGTGLFYLILIQCLRQIQFWKFGPEIVSAIPIVACAMLVIRLIAIGLHAPLEPPWPRGDLQRAAILRQLEHTPGEHLVMVHYDLDHDLDREWVYNPADLNNSKVLWARDLGRESNRELIDYYSKRRIWCVDPDSSSTELQACANNP